MDLAGRRLCVILNPIAGHGRAGRERNELLAAFEAAANSFDLITTEYPRHACEIVREHYHQYGVFVAAGGDGTVHEVASVLHARNSSALLGVIPLGTGNDFGRLLHMPLRPDLAVAALQSATPLRVDGGRVRWREHPQGAWHEAIFLNAVGIGFDAMVALESVKFKRFRGKSAYLGGIASALVKWPNPRVRVERIGAAAKVLPDGSTRPAEGGALLHEGHLFLAGVGNGRTVGGGFTLTPHAHAADGLLDLCFVEKVRHLRLAVLIPKVIKGTHLLEPEVVSERLAGLRILSPDIGLPMHFDGEVLTQQAREIEVYALPGAFRVLCPDPAIPALKSLGPD